MNRDFLFDSNEDGTESAHLDDPNWVSKTQLKQQMHEMQALALQLLKLPPKVFDTLDLEPSMRLALQKLRDTKTFSAQRRQQQYIGKLFRGVDPEPLRHALLLHQRRLQREQAAERQAQEWQQQLIENDVQVTQWMTQFPNTDVQRLRQLLRKARKTLGKQTELAAESYRDPELFKLLRESLLDATEPY